MLLALLVSTGTVVPSLPSPGSMGHLWQGLLTKAGSSAEEEITGSPNSTKPRVFSELQRVLLALGPSRPLPSLQDWVMLPTAHLKAQLSTVPGAESSKVPGETHRAGGLPHQDGFPTTPCLARADPKGRTPAWGRGPRDLGRGGAPRRAPVPPRARPPPSAPWPGPAAPLRDGARETLHASLRATATPRPPPHPAGSPPPQPAPRLPGSGSIAE